MNGQRWYLFLVVISLAMLGSAPVHAGQSKNDRNSKVMTLHFAGVDYLHRWSKDNQNEFTPQQDRDLASWRDMVTVIRHENVTNASDLADLANRVLAKYQENGEVLRTDSLLGTANRPAEHLVVALLGTPKLMEAVFARFLLVDGAGFIVIYAHRFYGNGNTTGPAMGHWLDDNAVRFEIALMAWDKIPKAAALAQLPQSVSN
jgi:hypothetical protein